MKHFSILLVAIVATMLGGCETCPQIIIEPADCAECQEGDFQAGMICMDSNVASAPFSIKCRLHDMPIKGNTYICYLLQPDGYTVTFEEVSGYERPDKSMDLELKANRRIVVTATYRKE